MANTAPSGTAASAPTSRAGTNGQAHTSTSRPATHAPNPANANCASDSWPA